MGWGGGKEVGKENVILPFLTPIHTQKTKVIISDLCPYFSLGEGLCFTLTVIHVQIHPILISSTFIIGC